MSAIIDKTKPKKTKKPKLVIVESDDVNIKTEIEETKPAPNPKPKSKSKKSKTTEVKVDEDDKTQLDTSDEKVEDYNPETNIKIIVSNEKNESEVVVNDYDEIVYSFHITNVHTGCTIQQLNSSLEILALGEVFQISIKTMYNGHITEKEKSHESRQSEAYIYYKGTMN